MAYDFTGLPIDNQLLSRLDAPVGTYRQSHLDLATFNAETAGTWVLADGQDVTGSDFEALTGQPNVPDARGQFLRSKNNGRSDGNEDPDGERIAGALQGDAIRNISGKILDFTSNASRTEPVQNGPFYGEGGTGYSLNSGTASSTNYPDRIYFDASRQVPTAGDNRPRNIAVHTYIKVGY